MRAFLVVCLGLAVLSAACAGKTDQREFTLQGQVMSVTPNHDQATINHEGDQRLHAGDDDALQGARSETARGHRAGRSDQREARRAAERCLPHGRQEGRSGAAAESARRSGRAQRVLGVRAAEARRGGPGRDVRRSGRQEAHLQLVQRLARPPDVHLHEVPDADVLPADGSALRRDPEEAEGRPGAEGARAPGERELRSGRPTRRRC